MMPIEIKELIIKASVTATGAAGGGSADQIATSSNNNVSPTEELVNTCVERILEILKDKHER